MTDGMIAQSPKPQSGAYDQHYNDQNWSDLGEGNLGRPGIFIRHGSRLP
jgi:hypothetical protein